MKGEPKLSVRTQKDKYGKERIRVDQHWPDGTRFRRNFPNKRKAEVLDAEIRVAKADGTWRELKERLARGVDAVRLTVGEFADRYIDEYCKVHNRAWVRKRDSMKFVKQRLGKIDLEALDANHVYKFIKWRKDQGRENGTINRDLAHLKHMLNYAVSLELIKENRISKVKKLPEILKSRPRFTDAQIDHFLKCADPRVRPMFGFIRETGCRPGEAMTLKRNQVNREQRRVVFTDNTKSGKFRVVGLTEECERWLDEVVPLKTCPYVFYNPKTEDCWKDCRKLINKAIKDSELNGFLLKDLRRHYGIALAEGGAEMHIIQAMLGHSSVTTTQKHYAHFSPEFAATRALTVLEGRMSKNGTPMGRTDSKSEVA
jgi:integrase/recombinase XerD